MSEEIFNKGNLDFGRFQAFDKLLVHLISHFSCYESIKLRIRNFFTLRNISKTFNVTMSQTDFSSLTTASCTEQKEDMSRNRSNNFLFVFYHFLGQCIETKHYIIPTRTRILRLLKNVSQEKTTRRLKLKSLKKANPCLC